MPVDSTDDRARQLAQLFAGMQWTDALSTEIQQRLAAQLVPRPPRVPPEQLIAQFQAYAAQRRQAEAQGAAQCGPFQLAPPWAQVVPYLPTQPAGVASDGTDLIQLQAEQRAARERARALLISYLDPEQAETYAKHGWFVVTGASGRRYKLANGMVLSLRPDGRHERHLCVVFADGYKDLPVEDLMLAQALLLSHDEPRFLALAEGVGFDIAALNARTAASLRSLQRLDWGFFVLAAVLFTLGLLSVVWGIGFPREHGALLALMSGLLGFRQGQLHRRGRRLLERVEAEARHA